MVDFECSVYKAFQQTSKPCLYTLKNITPQIDTSPVKNLSKYSPSPQPHPLTTRQSGCPGKQNNQPMLHTLSTLMASDQSSIRPVPTQLHLMLFKSQYEQEPRAWLGFKLVGCLLAHTLRTTLSISALQRKVAYCRWLSAV